MDAFKHVLAFTDGRPEGERAVEAAARLAKQGGGKLTIFHVVEPPPAVPGVAEELGAALTAAQLGELDRLRERARAIGVEADGEIRTGRPFVEIIRAAERFGCDLIVKAARGRARLGWPLLGSTALHLVRKSPVPVWIVGESAESVEPRRIIALLSSGAASEEREALDRRVLEVATQVAASTGAELSVGAAWDAPGESLLGRRMAAETLQAYVDGSRRLAEEGLGRALEPFQSAINPARVHLVRGVPYVELTKLAAERADLTVIGTAPPKQGAAFLIREEAEEVINRLETSIVAVKPDGFASPVLGQ